MVFHCSLSDSKSLQVSSILLSTLANVNNVAVWMVSTCPVICKSSSPCTNHQVTITRQANTVTFLFHNFSFNFLARSRYISLFSLSFNFTLWTTGTAKSTILKVFSFLPIIVRSGHLTVIRWSVRSVKFQRSFILQERLYPLFVWSNFNFLHNSQWITLPTQSCLVLISFFGNLRHSLIMWLIVSSLWPHDLHLLFYYVLSIFLLIWLVLRALCYIIRERFFILIIFHKLYFIIRFGWALNYSALSGGAGAHIEYSSRSFAEDMTITNVIIKNPEGKWDWGVNDVMPGSDGLRIWRFWKRS